MAFEKLSGVRRPFVVHVWCRGCGRVVTLDVDALLDRLGDVYLSDLKRRLRCSACGAADPQLHVGWDGISSRYPEFGFGE